MFGQPSLPEDHLTQIQPTIPMTLLFITTGGECMALGSEPGAMIDAYNAWLDSCTNSKGNNTSYTM